MRSDVLGRLVEALSDTTLDKIFEDNIFKPPGMTDTAFFVSEGQVEPPRDAVCEQGRCIEHPEIDMAAQEKFKKKPNLLPGGAGLSPSLTITRVVTSCC